MSGELDAVWSSGSVLSPEQQPSLVGAGIEEKLLEF